MDFRWDLEETEAVQEWMLLEGKGPFAALLGLGLERCLLPVDVSGLS